MYDQQKESDELFMSSSNDVEIDASTCPQKLWKYTNPVITGDWSDPAVIRVGKDYYSLRSTFGWQPGLALAHSKDLVHWKYIGNGFTSLPSISTGEVAGGIWGSELVYNPNTKMYMIYATYNGVAVFESAAPEGPYTEVEGGLEIEGYDPGVFVDDDGRVYMATASGKIAELSPDGKTVVNSCVSTYAGWNEGPEIFKRGDYYYVTWSSGGTEVGANGIILSARSKTLEGPWEEDPANPVMENLNNGSDPDHPLEGPQHPEVIETQNGEWWITFHTWEYHYGTLARNMCLEPVEWTDDGWWRPKNGKQPSLTNIAPKLPYTAYGLQRSDDFSSPQLGLQWFFHTTPDWTGESWSLKDHPGFLRLYTQAGDVNGADAYKSIPLQRIDLKQFEAVTKVTFDAKSGKEAAGLILHATVGYNVMLSLTRTTDGKVVELAYFTNEDSRTDGEGATRTTIETVPFDGTTAHLKVNFDGEENASFSFSADGSTWQVIGAPISVAFDGEVDLSWRLYHWSGAAIGLFAVKRDATADNFADFDSFTVTNQDRDCKNNRGAEDLGVRSIK
jgi:xylan 1,4-beta-xylosidase